MATTASITLGLDTHRHPHGAVTPDRHGQRLDVTGFQTIMPATPCAAAGAAARPPQRHQVMTDLSSKAGCFGVAAEEIRLR